VTSSLTTDAFAGDALDVLRSVGVTCADERLALLRVGLPPLTGRTAPNAAAAEPLSRRSAWAKVGRMAEVAPIALIAIFSYDHHFVPVEMVMEAGWLQEAKNKSASRVAVD
jgi:hypothetical protein